jgi:hypothetical protein
VAAPDLELALAKSTKTVVRHLEGMEERLEMRFERLEKHLEAVAFLLAAQWYQAGGETAASASQFQKAVAKSRELH